jgi:YrbI family 3-deoxy-D-manno-octulosonate 8-phosphate phosphatase
MTVPRIIFCDIDGTLTDGTYTVSDEGFVSKAFHTRDIHALRSVSDSGIKVIVVTGSSDRCNQVKMRNAGLMLYDCIDDKLALIKSVAAIDGVDLSDCLFIGDGQNDFEAMSACGMKACPQDASPVIKEIPEIFISDIDGGKGAVEAILMSIFD